MLLLMRQHGTPGDQWNLPPEGYTTTQFSPASLGLIGSSFNVAKNFVINYWGSLFAKKPASETY